MSNKQQQYKPPLPQAKGDTPRPRYLLPLVSFLLLFCAAPAAAATNRLILDAAAPVTAHSLSGLTEIIVTVPFAPANVVLSIDGREIGTRTTPPYTFSVDLGPKPLQHKLTVVARARETKQRLQWARIINAGEEPLALSLRTGGEFLEAVTTSPASDPVESVTFQNGAAIIATMTAPPFRIPLASTSVSDTIIVSAKTRSGSETADYFSSAGEVVVETVNVRTVPLIVSVTDRDGSARSGLAAASFRIYDKGRQARVVEFTKAHTEPIAVALVIDSSSSMSHKFAAATTAASKFVESMMREGDHFALFSIRSVPKREVALTSDKSRVQAALSKLTADGGTALYDALRTAIRELSATEGRRAIVVLSDGADTSSNFSFDELARLARESGIPVYVIDYAEPQEVDLRSTEEMRYLAGQTGGFVASASKSNLEQRYAAIENDLRSQYLIRYEITDSSQPGEWRPVKVVVSSSELSARTISGYFTP